MARDFDVSTRLLQFFDYLKKEGKITSQKDFCTKIGIKPAFFTEIKKGRSGISPDKLHNFPEEFAEYRDWILYAKGENPFPKSNQIKQNSISSNKESKEGYRNNGERGVPYYDIDVTASITESFNDVIEEPEFLIDFKPFNDCSAYLPIWGDSMYPAYAAGDIIAVKRLYNFDIIQWGEAHLVITNANANNMRTVKLLFPHEDQDKIILRASNPNYAGDTVINKSDILSLYIVKGKITRKQL